MKRDEHEQLVAIMGTLDSFDKLINNHMTEYKTAFGRLRSTVESFVVAQAALNDARDKALHAKIDAFKWGLALIASFTVISLGGFVALAIWALTKRG